MSTVQQLYELQELDLERDRRRQRLQTIQSQLGETAELGAARAEVARLEAELGRWRARRQDLELETHSLEVKAASVEERMYSGRVTNPKELTDLEREAASLRKQRGVLDERSLEALTALEENEARQVQAQAALSAIKAVWAEGQARLAQEKAELESQLAELDRARAEAARRIPGGDLAQYETLRRHKNGIAVAAIEDGFCSVCGVEVSEHKLAQLIVDEAFVLCGNCERILIE